MVIIETIKQGGNKLSGTKLGGIKAAMTNKQKYGDKFYSRIGRTGGRNGKTGGFAQNPELAKICGAIGGRKSSRKPKELFVDNQSKGIFKSISEIKDYLVENYGEDNVSIKNNRYHVDNHIISYGGIK